MQCSWVFLPLALIAGPALAQTAPDPATVTVPAITGDTDAAVISEGWKFFYFHRANTAYAEAYADIAECYRFMPVPYANGLLPMFVPWESDTGARIIKPPVIGPYGIVGDIIGGMVAGPLERRARQSRLRRCLEPRGYSRYPAPKDTWEKIIDNYSASSIAVQAKLASGPLPQAAALSETR